MNLTYTYCGYKIVESANIPKRANFKLSAAVPVTEEYRAKFDAWSREFFGEKDQMLFIGDSVYMSPEARQELRKKSIFQVYAT